MFFDTCFTSIHHEMCCALMLADTVNVSIRAHDTLNLALGKNLYWYNNLKQLR